MRSFLSAVIGVSTVACTAAKAPPVAVPRVPEVAAPVARARKNDSPDVRVPVDVIATLAQTRTDVGALDVGPAQLTQGGPSLQPSGAHTLEVDWLDERGSDVRVGVRLSNIAFAVWTARSRMLGIIKHEVAVSDAPFGFLPAPLEVTLKTNARVRRVAHKQGWTQVRYLESVQIEGWIPDDAIGERGTPDHVTYPGFAQTITMLMPGAEIRTEARWGSRVLAVGRYPFVVDAQQKLDDGWLEVHYEDSDARVHGFASQWTAPGAYRKRPETEPLPPLATTALVPAGTCLYAGDEPIGFVLRDENGVVDPGTRPGWFSITFDTAPWGAVTFDARGADASLLDKCKP